jgi:hypothetical protein
MLIKKRLGRRSFVEKSNLASSAFVSVFSFRKGTFFIFICLLCFLKIISKAVF